MTTDLKIVLGITALLGGAYWYLNYLDKKKNESILSNVSNALITDKPVLNTPVKSYGIILSDNTTSYKTASISPLNIKALLPKNTMVNVIIKSGKFLKITAPITSIDNRYLTSTDVNNGYITSYIYEPTTSYKLA